MARLYTFQGQYDQAEEFHRRALSIQKQVLSSDHHMIAKGLYELSQIVAKQGRTVEALALAQQAFCIYQKIFGADHLETLEVQEFIVSLQRGEKIHSST